MTDPRKTVQGTLALISETLGYYFTIYYRYLKSLLRVGKLIM